MRDIEKNTRPLPQIPLEVKYNSNYFTLNLVKSIDPTDGNYTMGITSFNTYNSMFNITSANNVIPYFDSLSTWYDIILPPGAYGIDQINTEIERQLAEKFEFTVSPIVLEANKSTLGSIIHLSDGYKIDFTQPNTPRVILGFDPIILSNSYITSQRKVSIIDIHRIHLCCDCIIGSIRNGFSSNILFSVILNEPPGAKIVREPNLILYKHIYKLKLDSISFWLEDDDGNQVDMHGETIGFTIHMKKNSSL